MSFNETTPLPGIGDSWTAKPASEHPLQLIDGQPISVESARAQMAALDENPDFQARVARGDASAFAERLRLWRVGHGLPADPPPAQTPEEVRSAMTEKDRMLDDQRINGYAKHLPLTDESRAQIRRGLVTQQQHDEAVRQLARMKADTAFCLKVLNNDLDAKAQWMDVNLRATLRVAPSDYDWSKDKISDFQG